MFYNSLINSQNRFQFCQYVIIILPILKTCENFKSFGVLLDIASFSFLNHNFPKSKILIQFQMKYRLRLITYLSSDVQYLKIRAFFLPQKYITEKKIFVKSLHPLLCSESKNVTSPRCSRSLFGWINGSDDVVLRFILKFMSTI